MSNVIKCQRCDKKLNPKTLVVLEYDQRTQSYTDQPVPAEFSQGGFEFGKDCAEVEKRLHLEKKQAYFNTRMAKAYMREQIDNHLSTEERQALVSLFLEIHSTNDMQDFPIDKDIDTQFVYIIYEF